MKDALGAVQSILVLGGTSDIGVATCLRLNQSRAPHVVLAVRKPADCHEIADRLRAAGAASVRCVEFDATDFASHDQFVAETFDRAGDFDVVIVAFGVLGNQAQAEHDSPHAREIVETNFTGVVSVTVPIVERLRAQGHGSLVLLSSVAGERVRRANFVYGSSKAGVDGYYQGLQASLAGSGVHVMIVRPGFVHSKMTHGMKAAPLAATPEQVASAIERGLRHGHEIVWVPPALRGVMMVLRHLPRVVFRRLPV
jgi:decaprenylphospho-beta-D-erythro-pentofuranosid-2-ulose 2-reductase